MNRFDGKVALVTGGTSGIGKATALRLASEGAKVVICGRRAELGAQTVEEIKAAGGEATYIQADVSKAADCKNLVDSTVATYGRLDCAFNNAGIAGTLAPLHEAKEEDWDEAINIILKSVYLCCKYEIEQMLKQGGGSIVNQGSAAGIVALPGANAYCVAKAGVIHMSRTAAIEYIDKNIRINCVAPAFVATPITYGLAQDYPDLVTRSVPMQPIGRMGTPEEIAPGICYLLSDEASFAYGTVLSLDGGYIAQ